MEEGRDGGGPGIPRPRVVPPVAEAPIDLRVPAVRARGHRAAQPDPRLLGFTFRAKVLSKRYYTLSVWQDEGALTEFVRTLPHLETMRALGPHMGETRFVRWTIAGSEVPPTWESAIARLEAEPTARHP